MWFHNKNSACVSRPVRGRLSQWPGDVVAPSTTFVFWRRTPDVKEKRLFLGPVRRMQPQTDTRVGGSSSLRVC